MAQQFLSNLAVSEIGVPTVVMEDNQGTIAIARNPVRHARTKHIDIKYHYVREAVHAESRHHFAVLSHTDRGDACRLVHETPRKGSF